MLSSTSSISVSKPECNRHHTAKLPNLTDIAAAIEDCAPLAGQESWDNSGWQIAPQGKAAACTGVKVCLDVTPETVAEAIADRCNLIVSHHPLIFKGLRSIAADSSRQQQAVVDAIRAGIAVYSSHTALDTAACGPSAWLGTALGLTDMSPLDPVSGLGITGLTAAPLNHDTLTDMVGRVYGGGVRVSPGRSDTIERVALCSGSGGEFIPAAIAAGADAYVSSDIRYHDFLDHGREIMIVDTGHFESEICTKSILKRIISEKFPNFAVSMCRCEQPPVAYFTYPIIR